MARGWESKAVEDQLEEAARARETAARPVLTPELIERQQRRESLSLLRSRLLDQLQKAHSEAQRQRLKQTLAELEAQLAALV